MNWYLLALKRYAEFNGRSRRKEYWYFQLYNFIALFVVAYISSILTEVTEAAPLIIVAYYLGVLIPSLAVAVRRLHDTNRSGWWLLISLVPLIGSIILLIYLVEDSNPGDNQYGPNPKDYVRGTDPTILDDFV